MDSAEIGEGVQKYIIAQQSKRKNVKTTIHQGRKVKEQPSSSLLDQREIFSEEDFCNPDYYKFRLPEFSKKHHDSLFQSQNKKLQEQRQAFEEKAVRSS